MTIKKSHESNISAGNVRAAKIDEIVQFTVEEYMCELNEIVKKALDLNISVYNVPTNFRRPNLIRKYVELINRFKKRDALFDTVIPLTMAESDLLLQSGVRRISRFSRFCPVDVVDLKLINCYVGSKLQNKIYTVLYHEFVFFLNGKRNFEEFTRNPYQYFSTCNPPQIQDKMRFAVVGPKYCNAAALCERIALQYGMSNYTEKDFTQFLSTRLYNTNVGRVFRENNLKINDYLLVECAKIFQGEAANGSIVCLERITPSLAVKLLMEACGFNIIFVLKPTWESYHCHWLKRESAKSDSFELARQSFDQYVQMVEEYMKSYSTILLNNLYIEHENFAAWDVWLMAEKKIIQTAKYTIGYSVKLQNTKVASLNNIFEVLPIMPFLNKHNTLLSGKSNFLKTKDRISNWKVSNDKNIGNTKSGNSINKLSRSE